MTNTTPASVAMLKVIEAWGVKHIFGYPGGSFNSTMSALEQEKERLQYIQVRHEQVGALAAAADAKLTGKIAVTFAPPALAPPIYSLGCTTPVKTTRRCWH